MRLRLSLKAFFFVLLHRWLIFLVFSTSQPSCLAARSEVEVNRANANRKAQVLERCDATEDIMTFERELNSPTRAHGSLDTKHRRGMTVDTQSNKHNSSHRTTSTNDPHHEHSNLLHLLPLDEKQRATRAATRSIEWRRLVAAPAMCPRRIT